MREEGGQVTFAYKGKSGDRNRLLPGVPTVTDRACNTCFLEDGDRLLIEGQQGPTLGSYLLGWATVTVGGAWGREETAFLLARRFRRKIGASP